MFVWDEKQRAEGLRRLREDPPAKVTPELLFKDYTTVDHATDVRIRCYLDAFAYVEQWRRGRSSNVLLGDIMAGKPSPEEGRVTFANCVCCGAELGGILGAFEWGIVHGEGSCAICGWPVRCYHSIADRPPEWERTEDGWVRLPAPEKRPEPFARLNAFLCYHPDGITTAAEREQRKLAVS